MTTANYYFPAELRWADQELAKDRTWVATKQSSFTRPKAVAEPETRLWKICAEVAPPRLNKFEGIALFVFGASAFLSLAFCAFTWFHLFSSGALDQVVSAILTR